MEKLTNDQILEIRSTAKYDFDKVKAELNYCHHLFEGDFNSDCRMTGFDRAKDIVVGATLIFKSRAYKVSSIEYRDHAGIFEDHETKLGTFFDAKLKFFANLF